MYNYWYDTRKDNTDFINRFPSFGWIFPCYSCELISSEHLIINYNDQPIYIPICKYCKTYEIDCDYIDINYLKKII